MKGPMRPGTLVILLAGLAGCAKSSAESALAAADKAIAAIQAEATMIAPAQLKALSDTLADVKARFGKGDFQSALMGARSVSVMSRDLKAQLATQKTQLTSAFESAQKEVPGMADAVQARVADLAKMRRLPPGIDGKRFAALQGDVGTWREQWTAAEAAFQRGELAVAMSSANQLRTKAREAMSLLQM